MDEFDNSVRHAIYRHFISEKKAPAVRDIADVLNSNAERIRLAFESLAGEHVLVLDPETGKLLMAMPFSAVPTDFRVVVGENNWWAN